MTSIVYTALPQNELAQAANALNSRSRSREEVTASGVFPQEGSSRYLHLPQLWRVLQAVFTGADTPDNDKLIAAIDGLEYLDGWSDIGAAYINAPEVAEIADALAKVNFAERLAAFQAHLMERGDDASEAELAAFAEQFDLKGSEEFEPCPTDGSRATELSTWFERLCAFYRRAADEGCGVVIEFTEWA